MESNNEPANTKSDVNNEEIYKTNWDETVTKFEDLNLDKDLLKGIFGMAFEKPSAIQQKAIKPILMGRDVIAQAQSGSGKTATFGIGVLQNIDKEDNKTQALIIAPTRELADQIYTFITKVAVSLNVTIHLSVGGTNTGEDRKKLNEGVQVVVGTPGRINDMVKRGNLKTANLKMLVIDEADEMLSLGFIEQINEVIKNIPSDTQIVLVSATMPPEIIQMTTKIMNNPVRILVKKEDITLQGIKQYFIACSYEDAKFQNIKEIFSKMNINQSIIYVNTKEKCEKLAESLNKDNFTVSCINGQMKPEERNEIMKNFRAGNSRILISTDLLSRGIDIHNIDVVINYELPTKKENYIHRIGRSGRYGRMGIAINLISKHEVNQMLDIEKHYDTEIKELPKDIETAN